MEPLKTDGLQILNLLLQGVSRLSYFFLYNNITSNDCKLRLVYASIHLKCQKLQIISGPNVLSFEVNDLIHSMQGKATNK